MIDLNERMAAFPLSYGSFHDLNFFRLLHSSLHKPFWCEECSLASGGVREVQLFRKGVLTTSETYQTRPINKTIREQGWDITNLYYIFIFLPRVALSFFNLFLLFVHPHNAKECVYSSTDRNQIQWYIALIIEGRKEH